ncbi:MAG: helix-turn-helix transcriptional regulator [Saprospiraceae bacterium]|nr:helix-turn-helix transcriptional regulator [Saprospiraceae bacterium]
MFPSSSTRMILFLGQPSFSRTNATGSQWTGTASRGSSPAPVVRAAKPGAAGDDKLHPMGAQPFMDFPISEITNTRADLNHVFKTDLEHLCDSLHQDMGEQAKARALDIFFKNKLRQVRSFDDRAIPLTQYILQTNGTVRLQDLTKKLFIGERTAQRIIHNAVGVNYKFFARTVRLEHVRNLMAQQHTSLTDVAHRAGYFDQAHFIHDFREAFGESPGAYLKKQQRLVWNRVV